MTIEALRATPPKKALFDKLLSHDDVQIQNFPKTSTTQDQEQTTKVAMATRRRSGSLPSLSDSVWSQESLKLDESFTSLGKYKHSVSFGALPATDEGIDDLEESFNLGGFPALDIGRPKVSKSQVSSKHFIKKADPVLDDSNYGSLSKGAANNALWACHAIFLPREGTLRDEPKERLRRRNPDLETREQVKKKHIFIFPLLCISPVSGGCGKGGGAVHYLTQSCNPVMIISYLCLALEVIALQRVYLFPRRF